MYNNTKLSKRMLKIAECIDKTTMFVDIGCDHGKVLNYLLENNLATYVVGVDISKQSADKAKKLLTSGGFENFSIIVSDGVDEFDNETIALMQTILISGLGGFEIRKILQNLLAKLSSKNSLKQVILQPQNNAFLLRKFLIKNGFIITSDKMIEENGKFYNIIKTSFSRGEKQKLNNFELIYGISNLTEKNADFENYLQQKYEQLDSIINNANSKKTIKQCKKEQYVIEKIVKLLHKKTTNNKPFKK